MNKKIVFLIILNIKINYTNILYKKYKNNKINKINYFIVSFIDFFWK